MSDEDDVRDKDYGVDANEYYYNGDSPVFVLERGACCTDGPPRTNSLGMSAQSAALPSIPKKVLVIEDEKSLHWMLAYKLSNGNCRKRKGDKAVKTLCCAFTRIHMESFNSQRVQVRIHAGDLCHACNITDERCKGCNFIVGSGVFSYCQGFRMWIGPDDAKPQLTVIRHGNAEVFYRCIASQCFSYSNVCPMIEKKGSVTANVQYLE
jgi:hypothetical protein